MQRSTYIILFLLLAGAAVHAQTNTGKWAVSFNPSGIIELEGALGAGLSYRVSDRIGLWTEASYMFTGIYNSTYSNVKGIRQIVQVRYYMGDEKWFFIAGEFRWKHFNFRDEHQFYNAAVQDTLDNFIYAGELTTTGGAGLFGFRFPKKSRLFAEVTVGLGVRYREINRFDIPAGYEFLPVRNRHQIINRDEPATTPYMPAGIRLFYLF